MLYNSHCVLIKVALHAWNISVTLGKALQVLLCSVQFSFLFKEVNILLVLKYIKSPTSVARQQRKEEKDSASKRSYTCIINKNKKKEPKWITFTCYPMVQREILAILRASDKGPKSLNPKPEKPHQPNLVFMHFTSTSTCMNFLSWFYSLTPMDYSPWSEGKFWPFWG